MRFPFQGRFVVALTIAVGLLTLVSPAGQAGAATQIGQTFVPTDNCSPRTRIQSGSPSGQYEAPVAGVITSWSVQSSSAGGESPAKLNVARRGDGDNFTIVGVSEFQAIPDADALNTFGTRLPVLAGDVIGLFVSPPSVFLCARSATGYVVHQGAFGVEVPLGPATLTPVSDQQLDVSATLEPDCDSDGFGDETQDPDASKCKDFSFGALKRNKKKGTATLTVNVPSPGELTGSGKGARVASPGLASLSKSVGAGAAQLLIKAKGKRKKKLNRTGKVKLNVAVTYTPAGGQPNTKPLKVKLTKKL